jgi:sec-independent protein translocase protein TatA
MDMLALIGPLQWHELLIILVIALLLFGRRLPEVGRSLGKGIVEFKKGLRNIEDDVESASNKPASGPSYTPAPEHGKRLNEPAYRAPAGPAGQDQRVSRGDPIDVEPIHADSPAPASKPQPE